MTLADRLRAYLARHQPEDSDFVLDEVVRLDPQARVLCYLQEDVVQILFSDRSTHWELGQRPALWETLH